MSERRENLMMNKFFFLAIFLHSMNPAQAQSNDAPPQPTDLALMYLRDKINECNEDRNHCFGHSARNLRFSNFSKFRIDNKRCSDFYLNCLREVELACTNECTNEVASQNIDRKRAEKVCGDKCTL